MARLQRIDELLRGQHYWLTADDIVYFLRERRHGGYDASETNQLISNFKKRPTASSAELRYKRRTIQQAAQELTHALALDGTRGALFVPTPPSKARGHLDYDDRLLQTLRLIHGGQLHVSELIRQTESMQAAHECQPGERPTVADLVERYEYDATALAIQQPETIVVFDDVITAGTHYRAMLEVLRRHHPNATYVGLFIARQLQDDRPSAFDDFDVIDDP